MREFNPVREIRREDEDVRIPDPEEKHRPPLQDINLSAVGRKLMEPYPEGKGWTAEQVAEAEMWYRRYLFICMSYPDFPAVPNGPIDSFWHQHILDTRAYALDCQKVFGYFLHHYPYFGLNGDADVRDDAFVETNALYRKHFNGEDCSQMVMFNRPKAGPCHTAEIAGACTSAPCVAEACKAGCKTCTVDGRQKTEMVARGRSCNHGGSGTGCGQGCRR